ncbi:hypothetical protein [Bradyrhizobium sp.]|uniref:hypothetical protein n=1 Tax=Bradyrhizobium sp. TaxID=376 RepID=UPI00260BBCAD|nr:hypothetical protein [Bradyrhizobium sp.]
MRQHASSTRLELEANRVFKPAEVELSEYAKLQKAFDDNRERLKSERLAREAAESERRRKKRR